MMVEHLKNEGSSHSSSNMLKIFVKMGASWSAQDFRQAGVTPSGPGVFFSFLLPEDMAHLVFADLNCRCGGEGSCLQVLVVVWRGVQGGCGVRCPGWVWGVFFFLNLQ